MRSIFPVAAAVEAALALPAQAGAQTITADPQQLVRTLQAAGYKTDLSTDPTGDPMITSAASGSKFTILFYNCTSHRDCTTIQFYVGYSVRVKPAVTLLNDWNREHRFGHAFTDKEGDPVLEMDVDMDKGGMSTGLFNDNLAVWVALVAAFEKHIGWS